MVSTIGFPDNAFELVQGWAKMSEYILQHLDELTANPVLPPNLPDPHDNEILEVVTCRFMFLPHAYIPLFLSSGGYTIKQAWELLYPALVQRQELLIGAPLIQWLRITTTGMVLANPLQMGPPSTAIRLYAPPADELLLNHRYAILHQVLPQLSAPPASLEIALNHTAAALIVQTNDT